MRWSISASLRSGATRGYRADASGAASSEPAAGPAVIDYLVQLDDASL